MKSFLSFGFPILHFIRDLTLPSSRVVFALPHCTRLVISFFPIDLFMVVCWILIKLSYLIAIEKTMPCIYFNAFAIFLYQLNVYFIN